MNIVLLIIGLILGVFVCYLCLKPKIEKTDSINEDIKKQNDDLMTENSFLQSMKNKLSQEQYILQEDITKLTAQKGQLEGEREQIVNSIALLEAQADESNKVIYDKSYKIMQESFNQEAEKLSKEYYQNKESYRKEYLKVMEETAEEFSAALALKSEEIRVVNEQLAQLRAKADAAIAAAKREEEKALEIDKYKIIISEQDLSEINRLREIAPYFRNQRPLRKIIWEGYYRTATNELLGRILETPTTTGIYKITNLKNQKIYIGQSVNINTRLVDHIKAGLGIDTPNNVLYAAMMTDGVENFSFEILETCGRNELNDRETFYIDFYQSQVYGYNMTKGGSKK